MHGMDRVFRTDELVRLICQYLHSIQPGSLPAFARVCKGVSDVALDVLWGSSKITPSTLYNLFPDGKTAPKSIKAGKKSCGRLPWARRNWSRFDVYAPRVRRFGIWGFEDSDVKSILPYFYHHGRDPFPGLKSLTWFNNFQPLFLITTFFRPTLTDLTLSLDPDVTDEYNMEDTIEYNMVNVLRKLGGRCPHLQRLSLSWPPEWNTTPIEEQLVALLHSSTLLLEVELDYPSVRVLHKLARLPSLRSLTLNWVCGRIDTDCKLQDGDSAFGALSSFVVRDAESLPVLTQLLCDTRCFPRRVIDVHCENVGAASDLTAFLQTAIHPVVSAGLKHFKLDMEAVSPSDAHNTPLITLQPFLALRHLRTFGIEPGFVLSVGDSDLKGLAFAWPEMEDLDFGTIFPYKSAFAAFEPQVTLYGLAHLAGLTKLEKLHVTLTSESTALASLPSPSIPSSSPLRWIRFGPGYLNISVVDATRFLVEWFPNLQTISFPHRGDPCYDPDSAQKWQEIQDELDGAREALRGTLNSDEGGAAVQ